MAKTVSIKPEETIARGYADRLILEQLTQLESAMKLGDIADRLSSHGLGLAAIRALLASNPERFAYHERRWVPAARLEGEGRSFHEAVRLVVSSYGGPISMELLAQEVARTRREPVDTVGARVRRVVERDPMYILTPGDVVALASWAFLAESETVERACSLFQIELADLEAAEKKLGKFDWRAEGAIAAAAKALAPVSAKVLCAAAWRALNAQDPRAVMLYDGRGMYSAILDLEGYVMGSDGVLHAVADTKKWVQDAVKLADRLAPTVDIEDAAPIEVKKDDVAKMVQRIVKSEASVTATKLLEDLYEITPSNKTFPDDLANVIAALSEQKDVWWVGGDRFRKAGSAPEYIYSVPEPFQFTPSGVLDDEGEPVDVELTDDGLSSSLRKLLSHPLAMDVLDEDILPAPKVASEKLRLVLKSMHRELGTFPMAQIPAGWIDASPAIQELIFVDPSGRELQVWANHDARLLFGLLDWFLVEQNIESGAVYSLSKTVYPNVFEFSWEDQADPVLHISAQRMEELRQIQVETYERQMSTLEVLCKVMAHYPKGADFLTLLAEINVVRRTPRRLVASLLSSYVCFFQRSGSPVWHYDAKKLDQGFDKTKKKFVKKV